MELRATGGEARKYGNLFLSYRVLSAGCALIRGPAMDPATLPRLFRLFHFLHVLDPRRVNDANALVIKTLGIHTWKVVAYSLLGWIVAHYFDYGPSSSTVFLDCRGAYIMCVIILIIP